LQQADVDQTAITQPIAIGIHAGGAMADTILMDADGQFKIGKSARPKNETMSGVAAQHPRDRIIQPDEVGAHVAFLCGERAKDITMENNRITHGAP
jgi:NAD(P)-dependent dehydrogenase (short-subunit alcohol dehydrogenase family)